MQLLEERIVRDGIVAPGNVLRVDSFINHQMDIGFMNILAEELCYRYAGYPIDKVLTVEASGIGIATLVALRLGVPLVFAKKSKSSNIPDSVYSTTVRSYTHKLSYKMVVSKEFLHRNERILLIDDFLANGEALAGMRELVFQARAEIVGAGILIEKSFQGGGECMRRLGMKVESLARIQSMSVENGITFIPDDGEIRRF